MAFLIMALAYQTLVEVVLKLKYPSLPILDFGADAMVSLLMWLVVLPVWVAVDTGLNRNLGWRKPGKRFVTQGILIMVLGSAVFLLLRLIRYYDLDEGSYLTFQDEGLRLGIFLFFLLLVLTVTLAYNVIADRNKSVSKLAEVERENAEFRFTMLKTQINPHFLFNNLNTLSGLIQEDRERAGSFLKELSAVYRNILDNREKNLLTLEEELHFFAPYKRMMETRFEERLTIELEEFTQESLLMKVPALCLQILTENAMKHNVVSKAKPLALRVYVNAGILWIVNPLQLKKTKEHSTKIGLNNIRKRLESVSSKTLVVEETNDRFKVGIPLILTS
jgi:hypothetical protein